MIVPIEFIAIFLTMVIGAMGALVNYLVGEIRKINQFLKDIADHLAKLNGRVGKGETWQDMHARQDDERHEQIQRETDALWREVRT